MPPARKNFALRLSPRLYASLERWASDELRSVNAQIEYLLAEAVKRAGRGREEGDGGIEGATRQRTDAAAYTEAQEASMNLTDAKAGQTVSNAAGEQLGEVISVQGSHLHIRTEAGERWVPENMVESVGDQVQVSEPGDSLTQRWLAQDPATYQDQVVDEAGQESFPASDPPSFTPEKG